MNNDEKWQRWFAWRPVLLATGKLAWWDYVERRYEDGWKYQAFIHDYQLKIYDFKGRCYTEEQIAYLMNDPEVIETLAKRSAPEDLSIAATISSSITPTSAERAQSWSASRHPELPC